jgi:hypothetical protein
LHPAHHYSLRFRRVPQIPEVGPERDRVTQVVVSAYQLSKQEPLIHRLDQLHLNRREVAHLADHFPPPVAAWGHRHTRPRAKGPPRLSLRQHECACQLQLFQQLSAFLRLEPA